MKWAWLYFIAFLGGAVVQADVLSINKFGGLNTDDSPLTLQGQTPDSENVVTDLGPGILGRNGLVQFSTEPSSGLWEFPLSNGTRYIITRSGTNLKAATANGIFNILISAVPSDRVVVATPLGDKFYFADTLNGLKYWDGSTVSVASAAMTVDKLVTWKGRLAASGKSAFARVIYLSKYLDGTSWIAPTNPSDDDAAQITVSGALDENIQALYGSFQDKLMWFKSNSFGGIYGSRRSNFSQRTFSDKIGVSSPETIQDCDGFLRWLGTNRVEWEFDGATFYKISDHVNSLFATVSQGDAASHAITQTSASDWSGGTQNPTGFLDSTSFSGSLTPKTTVFADTGEFDFEAGVCIPTGFCDTTTTPGTLSNKIMSSTITTGADFNSGTFTGNQVYVDSVTNLGALQTTFPDPFDQGRDGGSGTLGVWTAGTAAGVGSSFITIPMSGIVSGSSLTLSVTGGYEAIETNNRVNLPTLGTTYYFEIINLTGDGTGVVEFDLATTNLTNTPGALSGNANARIKFIQSGSKIKLSEIANSCSFSAASGSLFSLPALIKFYIETAKVQLTVNGTVVISSAAFCSTSDPFAAFMLHSNSANLATAVIDNFTIAPQAFTFTSPVFDTKISSPIWSTFSASNTATGVTYTSQVSADNVTYDSAVALTSGSNIASLPKRYLKINSIFSSTPTGFPFSPISLFNYNATAYSTGTFTSRTFDTGFNPPVWGLFYASTATTNAGSFALFTQASSDGTTWDSRVSISSGTKIASNKKRYLRYQADFNSSNPNDTESVTDVTNTAKSTGTFVTQSFSIGSLITAWGAVSVSYVEGSGGITIQFATSSTNGNFNTWNTISNNTIPTVSTAAYAAVRIIFDLDVATDTPRLDDITLNWTEGSTIRAASAYFNQRYWLGIAISSNVNNKTLLYDRNKQWQRYSGFNPSVMAIYSSYLYFGNSNGIYQSESGYSDNGSIISSYYQTGTFAPTKLDVYSNFDDLYMTTDNSDATLSTAYQINGSTTNYNFGSLQMNSNLGIQNFKLPFSASEVQAGKLINFKWSVSGSSFWRINNGSLYFLPEILPE